MSTSDSSAPTIAIIGTGFGGLGMGHYLKQAGIDSFTIFEKAGDVGGVWRENTYPGAACDVPSHLYSFSFEPHYPWAFRYGKQAEILDYLRHVANRHALMPHIRFQHEVTAADFDAARGVWTIRFADGGRFEANLLISAVGQLHRPQIPKLKGIEQFRGRVFHSSRWDHEYDFAGKRVAVIGNGPSAVQFVPELAKQVERLHLFQRSPGWCVPKFDRRFSRFERMLLRVFPFVHDFDRSRIFWWFEYLSSALQKRSRINGPARFILKTAAKLLMKFQVKSPALREKLRPDYPVGCKRVLLSNQWLPALAAPNVELVTDGIAEVTATGVRTDDGRLRDVDAIVYGTGFEATEFLAPIRVKGVLDETLDQRWKNGAEAYLGIAVTGFPNLFILYGPNTNLGAGSIIYMLERQQRYIVEAVQLLREKKLRYLEVLPQAQREYSDMLQARNKNSVFEAGCHNWYITADGRNTVSWVGYMSEYGRQVRRLKTGHYRLVLAAATTAAEVARAA